MQDSGEPGDRAGDDGRGETPPAAPDCARDAGESTRVEEELKRRLAYEHVLAHVAGKAVTAGNILAFLENCMAAIGATLDVDRAYIFEHRRETGTIDNTAEWCAEGITPQKDNLQGLRTADFPWWMDTLEVGRGICYSDIEDIPDEATRQALRPQGIMAIYVVPLFVGVQFFGFMGFDDCRQHRQWLEDEHKLVRTLSHIMTGAIQRRRAESVLQDAMHELARSNLDLKHFAYVASHDLQEPVRVVISYLQLLERRHGEGLDEEAREFVGYALDGALRLRELINGLLAYSRVRTHGDAFRPVNMTHALEAALANLEVAISEQGAQVTHEPLPTVHADEMQMVQLLQNLVSNAIKFRREGVAPQVHISVEDRGSEWVFAVRDNGIGIDPEQAPRIFEVFRRLHGREEYPGTGIGLPLAERIVGRHRGRIWLQSEPGKGSTFQFSLPKGDGAP